MTPTSMARWIGTVAIIWSLAALQLGAQSDSSADPRKAAQAKSQEEFDKYLEIVSATEAKSVILKTNEFVAQFPSSELKSPAYQYQMHAFETLNNFDGMLTAGRNALAGNPDNLNTLLGLAPAMATRAAGRKDREELLSQAQSYARRALTVLDMTKLSRKTPADQWFRQKRQMQSVAHSALGIVALQKGQNQAATAELKSAIDLAPQPEGIDFLRLGLALVANKNSADAEKCFRKASELGPDSVATAARDQLTKLHP